MRTTKEQKEHVRILSKRLSTGEFFRVESRVSCEILENLLADADAAEEMRAVLVLLDATAVALDESSKDDLKERLRKMHAHEDALRAVFAFARRLAEEASQ